MATNWTQIALMAAATGASAAGSAYAAKQNRKAAQQEGDANRQLNAEQFDREMALKESQVNPYARDRSLVTTLANLDALEQVGTSRGANIANVPYARPDMVGNVPRLTPQTLMAIAAMRDKLAPPGGGQGVSAAPRSAGADQSFADAAAGYTRRNEGAGGVVQGMKTGAGVGLTVGKFAPGIGTVAGLAGGALIGGAIGAMTKNAKTAATDFSLEDATKFIAAAYQQRLGREASPEEIRGQLQNIGWQPGHKYVGELGLKAIYDSLAGGEQRQIA